MCDDIGLTRAKRLVSPVFYSDEQGEQGEPGAGAPAKGPTADHRQQPPDPCAGLGLLISGLLEEGDLARACPPQHFQDQSTTNAGMRGLFTNFGAVPVTPRNMLKLLKNEEVILLFLRCQ